VPSKSINAEALAAKIRGRRVSNVTVDGRNTLVLHLEDDLTLVVQATDEGLITNLLAVETLSSDKARPTQRQQDYLAFIAKYIARFGRPPAESDIERHFLVSAPSVNQMMQTLERRGFIKRQPGVPRSTKLCVDLSSLKQGNRDDA